MRLKLRFMLAARPDNSAGEPVYGWKVIKPPGSYCPPSSLLELEAPATWRTILVRQALFPGARRGLPEERPAGAGSSSHVAGPSWSGKLCFRAQGAVCQRNALLESRDGGTTW
jgi:hypothetical protein